MRHKFLVTILSGFVSGVFISSFVDFGWALALFFVFLGLVFGITYYRHRMSIIAAAALFFIAVGGVGEKKKTRGGGGGGRGAFFLKKKKGTERGVCGFRVG